MPRLRSRVRVSFPAPGLTRTPACRGLFLVRQLQVPTAGRRSPAWWQSGYAAACKAAYAGSIPTQASIFRFICEASSAAAARSDTTPAARRRFCSGFNRSPRQARYAPRPGGETGIRKGLKIPRPQGHAGSTPAPGTRASYGDTQYWAGRTATASQARYGSAQNHAAICLDQASRKAMVVQVEGMESPRRCGVSWNLTQ